jgi:imidazolonepropionase-like amidohydrolase
MMRTAVLHGCDLVDGTGGAPQRGIDIVITGDTIREIVSARPTEAYSRADEIVEAGGTLAIPGLINNHTHGTAYGPLFPSGHEGLAHEQVRANLDRHLLEGTTTVLCVDGFVTAEALARTNDDHPVAAGRATCTSRPRWPSAPV